MLLLLKIWPPFTIVKQPLHSICVCWKDQGCFMLSSAQAFVVIPSQKCPRTRPANYLEKSNMAQLCILGFLYQPL